MDTLLGEQKTSELLTLRWFIVLLNNVNKEKQHYPDYIDKVPIPTSCLKRKVIIWSEMPFLYSKPQDN